jgi:formylglycine-generating enzyme required for sulfatase activity
VTLRLIAAAAAVLLVVLSSPVEQPRADGIMLVQASAFWMGRDDGPADEAPAHRVFLPHFWIERHKITNAEFAAFLNVHELQEANRCAAS